MGWGTGPWGTGPWGSDSSVSSTTLLLAEAIADRVVRVTVSQPPLARDDTVTGDALNPATWVVTRLDTGAVLTVLAVDAYDANVFDLSLLEVLGPVTTTHEVDASALLDASSSPIALPNTEQFPGLLASNAADDQAKQAARGIYATDIANPPFPGPFGTAGGTLVVNAGGDYASVTGDELVKKLVIRRLVTPKGGFFWLPDYGFGLQPKSTINAAQLPAMQQAMQDQVLLEREVQACTVSFQASKGNDYVTATIKVRTRSAAQPVSFTIPVGRLAA